MEIATEDEDEEAEEPIDVDKNDDVEDTVDVETEDAVDATEESEVCVLLCNYYLINNYVLDYQASKGYNRGE